MPSFCINGMTYFYVVKAVNEIGESEASEETHTTPLFQGLVLTASDAAYGDGFGLSVSMDDNYTVIGAPYKYPDPDYSLDTKGAAYIYVNGGNVWNETQMLTASDANTVINLAVLCQ